MKVGQIMTTDVFLTDPAKSIREAAQTMKRMDTGTLPVGEGDPIVGIVTDRDITVRAVANGLDAETLVGDVMSEAIATTTMMSTMSPATWRTSRSAGFP